MLASHSNKGKIKKGGGPIPDDIRVKIPPPIRIAYDNMPEGGQKQQKKKELMTFYGTKQPGQQPGQKGKNKNTGESDKSNKPFSVPEFYGPYDYEPKSLALGNKVGDTLEVPISDKIKVDDIFTYIQLNSVSQFNNELNSVSGDALTQKLNTRLFDKKKISGPEALYYGHPNDVTAFKAELLSKVPDTTKTKITELKDLSTKIRDAIDTTLSFTGIETPAEKATKLKTLDFKVFVNTLLKEIDKATDNSSVTLDTSVYKDITDSKEIASKDINYLTPLQYAVG